MRVSLPMEEVDLHILVYHHRRLVHPTLDMEIIHISLHHKGCPIIPCNHPLWEEEEQAGIPCLRRHHKSWHTWDNNSRHNQITLLLPPCIRHRVPKIICRQLACQEAIPVVRRLVVLRWGGID